MTIDPGLIRISMAYGYMRADDVLTAKSLKRDRYREIAERLSLLRKTNHIIHLRYAIWQTEERLFGHAPGQTTSDPSLLPTVRQMKRQLKPLIEARMQADGAVPADYERWSLDRERHPWTPTFPLWSAETPFDPQHILAICVDPPAIPLEQPVQVTVHAEDRNTHTAIQGTVTIVGQVVGNTNTPFK